MRSLRTTACTSSNLTIPADHLGDLIQISPIAPLRWVGEFLASLDPRNPAEMELSDVPARYELHVVCSKATPDPLNSTLKVILNQPCEVAVSAQSTLRPRLRTFANDLERRKQAARQLASHRVGIRAILQGQSANVHDSEATKERELGKTQDFAQGVRGRLVRRAKCPQRLFATRSG